MRAPASRRAVLHAHEPDRDGQAKAAGHFCRVACRSEAECVKTVTLLTSLCLAAAGVADELHLRSGGKVTGEWLTVAPTTSLTDSGRPAGWTSKSRRREVARAVHSDKPLDAYRRLASAARDTVEDQWRIAEWCREVGLKKQRTTHLRRIVELQGDHEGARHGLGYRFWRGEWITPEEFHRRADHVLLRGRWVTPQHQQLHDQREARREGERRWRRKLAQLRKALESKKEFEARAAWEALRTLDDPLAVGPLSELLRGEPVRRLQMLYIERLAAIGGATATATLMAVASTTRDIELFDRAARALAALDDPQITQKFCELLRHNNNWLVNRAAVVLRELDDESAVSPLIDALITTHVYRRRFGPGSQFQGEDGPKVLTVPQAGLPHGPNEPRKYTLGYWVVGETLRTRLSCGTPESGSPQDARPTYRPGIRIRRADVADLAQCRSQDPPAPFSQRPPTRIAGANATKHDALLLKSVATLARAWFVASSDVFSAVWRWQLHRE